MARHVVGVLLLGAALAAADARGCSRPSGGACTASDHSLLQVASSASWDSVLPSTPKAWHQNLHQEKSTDGIHHQKDGQRGHRSPMDLMELRTNEENRTIANITASVDSELQEADLNINLLYFAQHKLCAAEGSGGMRMRTLEDMMSVESLLQVKVGELHRMIPSAFPTDAMATNVTLENITENVGGNLKRVQAMLAEIAEQKNKNEVLGTETTQRLETLVSLLGPVTQECQTSGIMPSPTYGNTMAAQPMPATYGMMAAQSHQQPMPGQPTTAQSQTQPMTGQQAQQQGDIGLALPAEKAVYKAKGSGNDIPALLEKVVHETKGSDKHFQPFLETGGNLTLTNISTNIKTVMGKLEADISALVEEMNKLGVADSKGVQRLDNMREDIAAEVPMAGMMALQKARQLFSAVDAAAQREERREKAKLKLMQEQAKEHDTTELRKNGGGDPAADATAATPETTAISNHTIQSVGVGIENDITKLEKDVNTVTLEKHQVCEAAIRYEGLIQELVRVLSGMEC